MPNTNATVNSAIIAQTALTTLLAKFPILERIATDFSSASVKFNQDIITHIVTPTVARDFDPATGYVPDDQAQTDVSVKIDKHAYAGYAITDVERSTSQIDLNQRYADKVAYALGRKVCDDLLGLIVNANFNNKTEVAQTAFGRDTVVDISTKLNKRFIPDMGRFMFVNSDYYNALQKDEALYKAYITPQAGSTVVTGMLPDVNGFTVVEYAALPENGERLVGFAGIREGLIMPVPPDTSNVKLEVHLFSQIDDTPADTHAAIAKAIADVMGDKDGIKAALNTDTFVLHGLLLRESSTAPDEVRGRESVLTYEAVVSAV